MTVSSGRSDLKGFYAWLGLLGILVIGLAAFGQSAEQLGQITGKVQTANGQGLPGASVVLSPQGSNTKPAGVLTGPNGEYVLINVRYGTYALAATLTGFHQSEAKPLTVTSATATVDFILTPLAQGRSIAGAEKHAPTFSPAGIQGTTAPSGYSAGASAEETSQVMDRVGSLDQEVLSGFIPGEGAPDCNQEPGLLRTAQANPESFGPNHALGIFYLSHSNFTQSIRYLKLASEARPADMNNSRELALAYIGTKQYNDAIALLEHIAELNSRDSGLLRLLALVYEASGNSQKSVTEYLRAADIDNSEQNLFESGIGLIGLGSANKAVKIFASATSDHPGSARLWMGLGIAQDLQHLRSDAIRSLLWAVDADPEYFPPYSFLATLSGNSAETDRQIRRRLAEFVTAHPESPAAHYDYALALWRQRRLDSNTASAAEIESQLRLALEKDPKMARAHFQLGVVYADSGDYASATNELRDTVELEPGNAEAHYRLAQAYRRDKQAGLANLEIKKFEAMHGNPADGEDGSRADVHRLAAQLDHQMTQAAPCHEVNR